jgi:hypothetical protein
VRINDENNPYFVVVKSLKQGDPLSHIIFSFTFDVFAKMLSKAGHHNLTEGLMPRVTAGGILSLQYVDDTTLF